MLYILINFFDNERKFNHAYAENFCRIAVPDDPGEHQPEELAEIAGIADATMTDRMAGRSFFRVNEINRMAARLSIQESDYYRYFFAQENYPSRTPGRACSK